MAVTINEAHDNIRHSRFRVTMTAAESTEWFMFGEPKSAFTYLATHTTTGTFGVTLQGTVDGSNAVDIATATTNTSGTTFVTGKLVQGIRVNLGSVASSGSVNVTVIARDSA